jgi:hypothetical protein
MFCWPCIAIYACNGTNLMHYLPSIYTVTIPLHVSGLLVAHHQEVTIYICDTWYVLYVLGDCRRTPPTAESWRKLLPPDDGLLAITKHVEVWWLNKLKINSASSWFHYTHTLSFLDLNNIQYTWGWNTDLLYSTFEVRSDTQLVLWLQLYFLNEPFKIMNVT